MIISWVPSAVTSFQVQFGVWHWQSQLFSLWEKHLSIWTIWKAVELKAVDWRLSNWKAVELKAVKCAGKLWLPNAKLQTELEKMWLQMELKRWSLNQELLCQCEKAVGLKAAPAESETLTFTVEKAWLQTELGAEQEWNDCHQPSLGTINPGMSCT